MGKMENFYHPRIKRYNPTMKTITHNLDKEIYPATADYVHAI